MGLKILIVDDNPIFVKTFKLLIASVLKDLLEYADTAENGQDGLEKISEKPFDYVFMDVDMPVMNGIEATNKLNKDYTRQTTIVALTYHHELEIVQKMIQAGARHYIIKSDISPEMLERLFKIKPAS